MTTTQTGWTMTKADENLWRVKHPNGVLTEHKTEESALRAMSLTT